MEETSLTDFLDTGGAGTDAEAADADDEENAADVAGTDATDRGETASDADSGAVAGDDPPDEATATVPGQDDCGTTSVETAAVSPAAWTAAWSPEEATCEDCGDPVSWRYRDGEALVCPDCKSWTTRE